MFSGGVVLVAENKKIQHVYEIGERILSEIEKAVVGKRDLLRLILAATLSSGHVLIEDIPGLGKTLIARSLAEVIGLDFKRIQFTTDLLPSDITGGYIYKQNSGDFVLRKGPLFANVILADEINRASPKTQSSLLEAMQEKQITLEGETMILPNPFVVLATQNPIEYEGTFLLPEAQIDRFLIKVKVGYPSESDELEILENREKRQKDEFDLDRVTTPKKLMEASKTIEKVYVSPQIKNYIIRLVSKTREHEKVVIGSSPRGSLALLKISRAMAALNGRDHVLPDDIKELAEPTLAHRLILKPDFWLQKDTAAEVIQDTLVDVPVPVLNKK